jgi:predicted metal-dependent phosphoesterase TrpH
MLRLLIDLHLHTIHSIDSFVTLDDAIYRCKEEGIDGFAITNHDTMIEIPKDISEKSGLVIISGVEVSARGAHIVALDIQEEIPTGLSLYDTVVQIHDQGGLAIMAHPYSVFRTWVNGKDIQEAGFDCIEVANAYQWPYEWMLKRNTELAERLELPKTGGSDAHIPQTVGRAYTILESYSRDLEGVMTALRNGSTEAQGKGINLYERLKLGGR